MSTPLNTQKELHEWLAKLARRNQIEEERERGLWFVRCAAWIAGVMVLCLVLIVYRALGWSILP